MTEFISGHAHPWNRIDFVFLSNNGGRLQNLQPPKNSPKDRGGEVTWFIAAMYAALQPV